MASRQAWRAGRRWRTRILGRVRVAVGAGMEALFRGAALVISGLLGAVDVVCLGLTNVGCYQGVSR